MTVSASARTHSIATSPLLSNACPTPLPNSLLAKVDGYGPLFFRTAFSNPSCLTGSPISFELRSSTLACKGIKNDSYFGADLGLGIVNSRRTSLWSTILVNSRLPFRPNNLVKSASSMPFFLGASAPNGTTHSGLNLEFVISTPGTTLMRDLT